MKTKKEIAALLSQQVEEINLTKAEVNLAAWEDNATKKLSQVTNLLRDVYVLFDKNNTDGSLIRPFGKVVDAYNDFAGKISVPKVNKN
jgi:hypothetical protein